MKTFKECEDNECPKCGKQTRRSIRYNVAFSYMPLIGKGFELPEHIAWTCQGCGFQEQSRTKDYKCEC